MKPVSTVVSKQVCYPNHSLEISKENIYWKKKKKIAPDFLQGLFHTALMYEHSWAWRKVINFLKNARVTLIDMTCVIKQSLFTHQKLCCCVAEFAWQNVFTCQEINNLSYVLLGHLHRPLIAVQRRHARHNCVKIRLAWQTDKMGARKKSTQENWKEPTE